MQPFVAAVMLLRDRPEMARRAIRCFREQTYNRRSLLIWDNGDVPFTDSLSHGEWCWRAPRESIGEMRNAAIRFLCSGPAPCPDIIVTWDSDDTSRPRRIEEQVALLEMTGKDVAVYSDLLFWDARAAKSWLYRSPMDWYGPGTTIAFRRTTWERRPYPTDDTQEDSQFLDCRRGEVVAARLHPAEPRMIATIHGANSMQAHYEEKLISGTCPHFTRTPQWDAYCRAHTGPPISPGT